MNTTPESMDLSPEEAARALSGIRATQAQAVRATPWFPIWFPVGLGLSITLIQASSDSLTPVPLRIAGIVLAVALLTGVSIAVGRSGRMRAHKSVVDTGAVWGYMAWVLGITLPGVALGIFLGLRGVAYGPAFTFLGVTAILGLTGPLVARWVSRRNAAKIERGA
ncbi:hypothetical protein [Planomonospora algeriensis]